MHRASSGTSPINVMIINECDINLRNLKYVMFIRSRHDLMAIWKRGEEVSTTKMPILLREDYAIGSNGGSRDQETEIRESFFFFSKGQGGQGQRNSDFSLFPLGDWNMHAWISVMCINFQIQQLHYAAPFDLHLDYVCIYSSSWYQWPIFPTF